MTSESQPSQGGLEAHPAPEQPARTPAELEAEIERTRERLAGTVDAIAERVKPANVARRSIDSARDKVVDDRGNLRTSRVAVIGVVLVAVAGLLVWRRRR